MSTPFGTPPPPPPKPSGQSSGISTPAADGSTSAAPRPAPPVPDQAGTGSGQYGGALFRPQNTTSSLGSLDDITGPVDGWLPDILKDKSTAELQAVLASPQLQHALIHDPQTQHASIPASTAHIQNLLAQNIALASSLVHQEQHLAQARQHTQSRMLALRALERQWKQLQQKQDDALRDFSASALYQKLAAAVGEQSALVRTLEEGWLEEGGEGVATEREVADIVRRTREARKVSYLRRERKERWDEGRIGGWRG